MVTLLNGQEIWSAIECLGHVIAKEGVIVCDSLLSYPVADGTHQGHVSDDGIHRYVIVRRQEIRKHTKIIGSHAVNVHRVFVFILKTSNLVNQASGVALLMLAEMLVLKVPLCPDDKGFAYRHATAHAIGIGVVIGKYQSS